VGGGRAEGLSESRQAEDDHHDAETRDYNSNRKHNHDNNNNAQLTGCCCAANSRRAARADQADCCGID